MLKKLFIHEWKDCWKLLSLLNVAVLVLTVIGVLTFRSDIWSSADKNRWIAMMLTSYILFYVVAVMALSMVSTLYFWYRFYRNLYTDQGYLMHTLPVNAHQLIWAKTFVALIWQIICMIVMAVSVFSIVFAAALGTDPYAASEIASALRAIELDGFIVSMILLGILLGILCLIMSIFLGYAAVSLGQLVKKHRLGAAVGIYVALQMGIQTVTSYATIPMSYVSIRIDTQVQMRTAAIIIVLVMIAVAAACSTALYFVTHYIMRNKLNLE